MNSGHILNVIDILFILAKFNYEILRAYIRSHIRDLIILFNYF